MIVAAVPGELDWARATYQSVRGPIAAAWRREGGRFALDVDIPANVTATVVLPPSAGEPTEGGPALADAVGVAAARREGDTWTIEIGSGRYGFQA